MVGKINPSDDNKRIPPKSQDLSFHQDYTTPQQKVMNEHISELKNLLKHADSNNPEIQQRIAQLRHQIQYEDLPAVGLSERRKPTISDALEYIDQQSGYAAYQAKQAALEATFNGKKSKKSSWRQLAGSAPTAPTSVSMSKTQTKLKVGSKGISADDLNTIATNVANWQKQNPSELNSQISAIQGAISALAKTKTQNSGASLRSFIQLNPDLKTLFNPQIYNQLSDKSSLKTLFSALNFDSALLPSTTPPASPPFVQGYTAFVLKDLPKDVTQISVPSNRTAQGDTHAKTLYAYVPGKGQLPVKSPIYTAPDQAPANQQFINVSDLRTFTDPATGQTSPVLYIPTGMPSTQIVFGPAFSTFCECTIGDPDPKTQNSYRSDLNFTGVNGIPPETINIQMGGTNGYSSRNGINTDRASFVASMQSLYDKYDPSGVWKSTMFEADGTIKSGKFMTDPKIVNSMSNYLTQKFLPQLASTTFYFMDDGNKPDSGHAVKNSDGSWSFISANFPNQPQPLPSADDMNAWISGGAWPAPGQNGFIKAITSFVNLGIPPTLTSATNIAGNAYFTNLDNVKNFYQGDFYNIYRRAAHESGCNAYAADYDDEMGGDGELNDSSLDQTFFTISLGASSPTPPAFDPNSIADQLFDPKNDPTIAKEWKGENVVANMNTKTQQLNTAIAKYKNSPTQDNWNALQTVYKDYQSNMPILQKQATTLATDMLNMEHGSELNDVVRKVTGKDATYDQLVAVAGAMATHEVDQAQPMPGPPGPPSFNPNKAVDDVANDAQGKQYIKKYTDYAQWAQTESKAYQNDLAIYNSKTGQDRVNYYNNTLLPVYTALKQACDGMRGMALTIVSDNEDSIKSILVANRDLDSQDAFTDEEQRDMAKVIENRYLPTVPDVPTPPGPPITPAQATAAIYGDSKLQFHNKFMSQRELQTIQNDVTKYNADLATYNAQKTLRNFGQLQADSAKYSQDLRALTPAVLQLLQSNSAEIQSLGINPSQFQGIAAYIVGTQEKGNIPAIGPLPPPPGPPLNPAQQYLQTLDDWLTAHNDKGSGDGIYQELEQPLSAAIQKSGFTTVADIQNWLKNSAAGKQAMSYLTSPTIYAKDPALAALPAGAAQSAALQDLFNKLQITAPVPTPPGPPPLNPAQQYLKTLDDWLTAHNDKGSGDGIYQELEQPLSSAIQSGKFTTVADIQNWLKNSTAGRQAMSYLTSPTIYAKDPALAALPAGAAQSAALQDLFNKLQITAPVPTPPGPPPPSDLNGFKDAINKWLSSANGEKQFQHAGDQEGYLRKTFADRIFGLIDSHQVTTMDQLRTLITSGLQGQGPLAAFAGLLSQNIYSANPAFAQMDPTAAKNELQDFFNVLGIKAPVPTPPGPPPTDDVARLLAAFPGQLTSNSGMWTQQMIQLMQDIKVHATPAEMAGLMKAFYKQYMSLLPGLLAGRKDFPLPASQYATELCQAEWKKSGATGPCPPLT